MSVRRIAPHELQQSLLRGEPPLVLDVRRSEALRRQPAGIAGAVPLLLDEAPPQIPDLERDTPIIAYCLCSGQASSTRVALWLQAAGYTDVRVLDGGLPAWQACGLPMAPISSDDRDRVARWTTAPPRASGTGRPLAELIIAGESLPTRRDMAVLFVDMVDSTSLLFSRAPEEVLKLVQAFMQVVVDVAARHCGDVHDFEGDGAMLYFAGPGEAVPAAFELRSALAARRLTLPELPRARFAVDGGPLVIGYVGGDDRRGLSFIGPSVNTAARILKLAPADGIVVTDSVIEHARRFAPDLAEQFRALPEKQHLKGFEHPVAVHVAREAARLTLNPLQAF